MIWWLLNSAFHNQYFQFFIDFMGIVPCKVICGLVLGSEEIREKKLKIQNIFSEKIKFQLSICWNIIIEILLYMSVNSPNVFEEMLELSHEILHLSTNSILIAFNIELELSLVWSALMGMLCAVFTLFLLTTSPAVNCTIQNNKSILFRNILHAG